MSQDESPTARQPVDPPPIGQGVLADASPRRGRTALAVLGILAGFVALVAIIANRDAILRGLKRLGDDRPREQTARPFEDERGLPTSTCGAVGPWKVCTVKVKRRPSISDGFRRWSARKDAVYLTVLVKISHVAHDPQNTIGLTFAIGDADGNRYGTDDDVLPFVTLDGDSVCGLEEINPGFYSECWAVFYLSKGTPGIHLVATYDGREEKISLGE